MSEYLLPFNDMLTNEEKCELFGIKNRISHLISHQRVNSNANAEEKKI